MDGELVGVIGKVGLVRAGSDLFAYDTRNRLTNLGVNHSTTALASYGYTLDASGHRTAVTELSGRTVNYGYDNLYRLTSEGIASDPGGQNGTVGYTYDAVGNRKQMTSTVPAIPAGSFSYNANDQFLVGDTYDANGNTTSSGGIQNTYDFENRLVQKGGVAIVYDGDGNRVAKTVAGAATTYLVDTQNPTGYAQVLVESNSQSGATTQYLYGLALVAESRTTTVNGSQQTQTSYYVFDGHGSVRALTNTSGAITDTYDYDAFGNLIHSTGSTPNNYLYSGEQFDPDLGLYYNRARYLNVSTGRFWTMDALEGEDDDPLSLPKYLYAEADSVDNIDPSGNQIDDIIGSFSLASTINAASVFSYNNIAGQTFRIASTVSFRGIQFIESEEGLKRMPYDDLGSNPPRGNCTIGYGHLIHLGICTQADFSQYPGGITQTAAEQLLYGDVFNIALFPIKFLVNVPLAQKELDALVDFTFNIGSGNSIASLQKGKGLASTTLLRVLNLGLYSAVPAEFKKFVNSGGIPVQALVRRRNDEANLWITGIYFANGKLIP